ncbi:MAG: ABC transporter permease [Bacillota bacterium]|nr:ABC transporter permease [Bacillota bacterium]
MMTIAFTTFKEAVRKKLFLLVGILTFIYLSLFTIIVHFYVKDMNNNSFGNTIQIMEVASQLISVLGFYFSSMLVALLTIVASVSAISSEVENGTIHSIITKPIKRYEYILGKYIGLGILSGVYAALLFILVILITKVQGLPVTDTMEMSGLVKGMGFFILQPLVILSLAIFGSSSLKSLTNGIIVVSIYILGLIGSMMEQIGSIIKNDSLYKFGILSSLISPFDLIYRKMLSVVFSGVIISNPMTGGLDSGTTSPSIWMMFYIGIYLVGLLILAVLKFNKRDIS